MTPTVNRNIRAELARTSRRQSDLAAALKLGEPALSRRLAGKVPWTLDELAETAKFLGVEYVDLFREITNQPDTTEES